MIEGAVLIAGPTASGKSRLALEWADRIGGVIVNTDSMQVYSGLRVLTARPGDADMRMAPHRLYGHIDPANAYSTGQWLRDVAALAAELEGRRLIFVGGTGLYFKALTEGLSAMPTVPDALRQAWRRRLDVEGAQKLHNVLASMDAAAANMLKSTDGQRIVRALEVFEASGRSILAWQADKGQPAVNLSTTKRFLMSIERPLLHDRINRRFDAMIEEGALDEVEALVSRNLDTTLPAMRAIGVPEIARHLAGSLSLAEALLLSKASTRQYAKRQMTWFRNQLGPEWEHVKVAQ